MSNDPLLEKALSYCKEKDLQLIIEPRLGAGTDGTVWNTTIGTAVKTFYHRHVFVAELRCCHRLGEHKITEIDGFSVPRLHGFDCNLWAIEIDFVETPFLLDFGKTYLDKPPDYYYDPMIIKEYQTTHRDLFGNEKWLIVQGMSLGELPLP